MTTTNTNLLGKHKNALCDGGGRGGTSQLALRKRDLKPKTLRKHEAFRHHTTHPKHYEDSASASSTWFWWFFETSMIRIAIVLWFSLFKHSPLVMRRML